MKLNFLKPKLLLIIFFFVFGLIYSNPTIVSARLPCTDNIDCGCGYCCNSSTYQCYSTGCFANPCTTPINTPTPISGGEETPTPTSRPGATNTPAAGATNTPPPAGPTATPNPACVPNPVSYLWGHCDGPNDCPSGGSSKTCENHQCKYSGLKPCPEGNWSCANAWIPTGWNCDGDFDWVKSPEVNINRQTLNVAFSNITWKGRIVNEETCKERIFVEIGPDPNNLAEAYGCAWMWNGGGVVSCNSYKNGDNYEAARSDYWTLQPNSTLCVRSRLIYQKDPDTSNCPQPVRSPVICYNPPPTPTPTKTPTPTPTNTPTPTPKPKTCQVYQPTMSGNRVDFTWSGLANRSTPEEVRAFIASKTPNTYINPVPPGLNPPLVSMDYVHYQINSTSCNSASQTCTATTSINNLPPSNYYFMCDMPTDPRRCSGNPRCEFNGGPYSCSGYENCGSNDWTEFTVYPPLPNPPSNLTAECVYDPKGIKLTWDHSSANQFKVYRYSLADNEWIPIALVGTKYHTDYESTIPSITYQYKVTAIIGGEESNLSNEVGKRCADPTNTPRPPTNTPAPITSTPTPITSTPIPITSTPIPTILPPSNPSTTCKYNPKGIKLTWTDNSNNESGFRINRCSFFKLNGDCISWDTIAITGANTNNLTDGTISFDTNYKYRVGAIITDSNGNIIRESDYVETNDVMCSQGVTPPTYTPTPTKTPVPPTSAPLPTLNPPSNLTAICKFSPNSIELSWNDNTGGQSMFEVTRDSIHKAYVGSTYLTDNNIDINSSYIYGVRAIILDDYGTIIQSSNFVDIAINCRGTSPTSKPPPGITITPTSQPATPTSQPIPPTDIPIPTVNPPNLLKTSCYFSDKPDEPITLKYIHFSWNDTAPNSTGFDIERRVNGGPWLFKAYVGSRFINYIDDYDVSLNNSYTYRMRTISGAFYSEYRYTTAITCEIPDITITPTNTQTPTPTPTPTPVVPDSWYKVKNSSFYKNGYMPENLPSTLGNFDIDDNGSYINVGEAGVASSKNNGGVNQINVSSKKWLINNYSLTTHNTANSFIQTIKAKGEYTQFSNISEVNTPNTTYLYNGNNNLTINNSVLPEGVIILSEKPIVFSSNLNGADKITFISNSNGMESGIQIKKDVTLIKAILITNSIDFASDVPSGSTTRNTLKINGNLSAETSNNSESKRKREDLNKPSIFIINQPQWFVDLLPKLNVRVTDWKDVSE